MTSSSKLVRLIFFVFLISKYLYKLLIFITGLDGGRGSLKICLTIQSGSNDDEDIDDPIKSPEKRQRPGISASKFKYSGVRKLIILSIVEDLPEDYNNVKKLMEALNLDEFTHVTVADHKLQNQLLGMNAHGATHCCPYCEV